MPIVDVEIVCSPARAACLPSAAALASSLGRIFGSAPGRTWVRLRVLDSSGYGENDSAVAADELPVFVTVLHAHPPAGPGLREELMAVTEAVAGMLGSPAERVHVQYAPAAAGRQAFGGHLVE